MSSFKFYILYSSLTNYYILLRHIHRQSVIYDFKLLSSYRSINCHHNGSLFGNLDIKKKKKLCQSVLCYVKFWNCYGIKEIFYGNLHLWKDEMHTYLGHLGLWYHIPWDLRLNKLKSTYHNDTWNIVFLLLVLENISLKIYLILNFQVH